MFARMCSDVFTILGPGFDLSWLTMTLSGGTVYCKNNVITHRIYRGTYQQQQQKEKNNLHMDIIMHSHVHIRKYVHN